MSYKRSYQNITCYRHHIKFIDTYFQMNYILRGFTLKFHHNTLNSNYSKIKISKLLMTSTLGHYKKLLLRYYEDYNSHFESVRINWNNKCISLID